MTPERSQILRRDKKSKEFSKLLKSKYLGLNFFDDNFKYFRK